MTSASNCEVGGDVAYHRRRMRQDARRLADERGVNVDHAPTRCPHAIEGLAQQDAAVGARVGRIGVRKEAADVAQPSRTQQRIGERMQQHVGVGMTEQAALEGDGDAADDQRPPGHERMHVEALAHAERKIHEFAPCLFWRIHSARCRSSG